MGRCQLMILLLTLCLINFNSRAKPPDIVWRVDTRDHHEIFSQGFYSSGDNDLVLEHLVVEAAVVIFTNSQIVHLFLLRRTEVLLTII